MFAVAAVVPHTVLVRVPRRLAFSASSTTSLDGSSAALQGSSAALQAALGVLLGEKKLPSEALSLWLAATRADVRRGDSGGVNGTDKRWLRPYIASLPEGVVN
eukprot:SAG11_NODE_5054_length_1677_cov_4.099099_1_plen_102_part_10